VIFRRETDNAVVARVDEGRCGDQECADMLLREGGERRIQFGIIVGARHKQLLIDRLGCGLEISQLFS
jgi:hypothetical protein